MYQHYLQFYRYQKINFWHFYRKANWYFTDKCGTKHRFLPSDNENIVPFWTQLCAFWHKFVPSVAPFCGKIWILTIFWENCRQHDWKPIHISAFSLNLQMIVLRRTNIGEWHIVEPFMWQSYIVFWKPTHLLKALVCVFRPFVWVTQPEWPSAERKGRSQKARRQ